MLISKRLFWLGEVFFLAAVTLLIIRNNNYPLIIKRASDIYFFSSLIIAIFALFYNRGWSAFLKKIKNPLVGFLFVFTGLFISSFAGYLLNGRMMGGEGILTLLRFIEVGIIIFLVALFQSDDSDFYKKVAIVQLSTLAYLPFLFIRQINPDDNMGRFNFFENWPSNVGYYLIVSLAFTIVWLLFYIKPFKWKFIVIYIVSIGFTSILLGTQSRASWLAIFIIVIFTFLLWIYKERVKILHILLGAVIIISLIPLGFFILPKPMDTIVLLRIFPRIESGKDFSERSSEIITTINKQKLISQVREAGGRPRLWKIYIKKLIRQPLGFGLNYKPINIGQGDQGPHNTPLETLVLGGIIALAGTGYLLFLAFKNVGTALFNHKTNYQWPLYIFISLSGLFIASLFDNMVTFRLMWVMIALA